jgi:aspartate/methionine/tyrosine aminotransferase
LGGPTSLLTDGPTKNSSPASRRAIPGYTSTVHNNDLIDVPKVTLTERRSLTLTYNLADAQNYVSMNVKQRAVIDQLANLFDVARGRAYGELKQDLLRAVLAGLQQKRALCTPNNVLLCYSATIGLEVAATYARLDRTDGRVVGLIHPTFDTLAYIALRHNLRIKPIEERELLMPAALIKSASFGVIILTLPNNPTGFQLHRDEFTTLVAACQENDILLIIDCCYRYYSREPFDYYEILVDSGVDYLVIEDTGKLFPLLDIKLGMLNCNDRIFPKINSIHSDFLLEVSKFSMTLITEFFRAEDADMKATYLATIEANRDYVISNLGEVNVLPIGGQNINVQLLRVPDGMSSGALQDELARRDVGIIDATKLYWADPARGRRDIRIALARDPEYLAAGVATVRNVINDFKVGGRKR